MLITEGVTHIISLSQKGTSGNIFTTRKVYLRPYLHLRWSILCLCLPQKEYLTPYLYHRRYISDQISIVEDQIPLTKDHLISDIYYRRSSLHQISVKEGVDRTRFLTQNECLRSYLYPRKSTSGQISTRERAPRTDV